MRCGWLIANLAICLPLWLGCDEGQPCAGGCAVGQVCDSQSGQCVDMRPSDRPPDMGRYASAAVDTAGRVWIAAYAARFGDLALAFQRSDDTLSFEYVDGLSYQSGPPLRDDPAAGLPGDDVGLYSSLALDGFNRPHIAYFDRTHGRLRYALKTGQGWDVVSVPRAADDKHVVGRAASLALDKLDQPHIAFHDETAGAIMLARKFVDGRWAIEQVDACPADDPWPGGFEREVGRTIALVLDKKDGEWVVFRDVCTTALKMATRKPEGWSVMEVDSGPDVGGWVAAALDGGGNVAIAYFDRAHGALKYAFNNQGNLQVLVVDDGRRQGPEGAMRQHLVGQHLGLAFAQNGLARIVYQDSTALDLLSVAAAGAGEFGQPRILDEAGPTGFFGNIVTTPEELRVIVFKQAWDAAGLPDGTLISFPLESTTSRRGDW